jgi:MerR family transcriptional regulator, thiopeptide resistance regulator
VWDKISGTDKGQNRAILAPAGLAQLKVEMDSGTDPADPKVQALEKRRQALVNAFSGGDEAIEENLKRMWTEQGDKLCAQFGIDPKLMAYLGKAAEAAR